VTVAGLEGTVLPAPTADLEVARRISGAPDVTAYFAAPGQRSGPAGVSRAWAEVVDRAGHSTTLLATLGVGLDVTAAVAAETARRILDRDRAGTAGAWTPGMLFGPDLLGSAVPVEITAVDRPTTGAAAAGGAR
jgi:hypothetical protein